LPPIGQEQATVQKRRISYAPLPADFDSYMDRVETCSLQKKELLVFLQGEIRNVTFTHYPIEINLDPLSELQKIELLHKYVWKWNQQDLSEEQICKGNQTLWEEVKKQGEFSLAASQEIKRIFHDQRFFLPQRHDIKTEKLKASP
jgi:hypothetical protein